MAAAAVCGGGLTDAGGDGRAALLVALSAAVAGDPCHPVLAGTLARRLVARLPRRSDGMAVARCGRGGNKEASSLIGIRANNLTNEPVRGLTAS